MSSYDPNKVDAYAEHLAEANQTNEVVATDDILNEQGALLVKKGTPINPKVTQRIVKFKLVKPLEHSVSIENQLDATSLHTAILELIKPDPAVYSVYTKHGLDTILRQRCRYFEQFPILCQKMTVMSLQLKTTYEQSLFSAWLATLIAKQMKLSDDEIDCVFLAALTHDVGMLHISPDILNKKGELTPDEWRQIQAHPIIGQRILENIDDVPRRVIRAVAEHHERCDGTGYPKGLFENELSLLGQIIALSDSVIAVYWKRFRREGRSLRDLIPIIQINSKAHFYRSYETLVTILRNSDLSEEGVIKPEQMPSFISYLLDKNIFLNQWLGIVEKTLTSFGYTHENRKIHAMQNVFLQVVTSIRGAGVLDEGYIRWLQQVKEEKLQFAYREIEDVSLMVEELEFHLKRLTRMMNMYLVANKGKQGPTLQTLAKALKAIHTLNERSRPEDPKNYSL